VGPGSAPALLRGAVTRTCTLMTTSLPRKSSRSVDEPYAGAMTGAYGLLSRTTQPMGISLTRYLSGRFSSHTTNATVRVWPEPAGAELANDQVGGDAAARPAAGLGLRWDRCADRVSTYPPVSASSTRSFRSFTGRSFHGGMAEQVAQACGGLRRLALDCALGVGELGTGSPHLRSSDLAR